MNIIILQSKDCANGFGYLHRWLPMGDGEPYHKVTNDRKVCNRLFNIDGLLLAFPCHGNQ